MLINNSATKYHIEDHYLYIKEAVAEEENGLAYMKT
jgi:hypothetical protein